MPVLSVAHGNNLSIHDTLVFTQTPEPDDTKNLIHKMSFTQSYQYELDVSNSQSLTITSTPKYAAQYGSSHTLTLVDANSQTMKYNTPIQQPMVIVQAPQPNFDYPLDMLQTISPKQVGNLTYANYYMFCHCVNIAQSVTNAVPLSVQQTLEFQWTELEVYYDTLNFMQTATTNYDDVSCCNPAGSNNDGDGELTLVLAQNIGCAMTYNVSVTQQLNLLMSGSWRP
jgi:hypothetical protein